MSAGQPPSDPSARVLDGAVDWLTDNLHWFDPVRWESFLPRRPFPSGTVLELLVLCRVLRRGRLRGHELLTRAIELAERQLDTPAFQAGLRRGDQAFAYHAYLVALLHDAGCPVPRARDRVQSVLDLGSGDQTGAWRTVQHRLELKYILNLGGFLGDLPDLRELVDGSIVADEPDPLWLRDDEAYAITHVIFYSTDFGGRPMPGNQQISTLCRTMLGVYLATGNLDLAGEFLLCLDALQASDCLVREHGRRLLGEAQRPDGAVPGPLYQRARWAGLSGQQAAAYLFGTCHHTTMVAAMASAERERRHVR